MSKIVQYARVLVGGAGAIVTALVPYFGGSHWFVGLTAGLTALYLYLVNPNPPTQGQ